MVFWTCWFVKWMVFIVLHAETQSSNETQQVLLELICCSLAEIVDFEIVAHPSLDLLSVWCGMEKVD